MDATEVMVKISGQLLKYLFFLWKLFDKNIVHSFDQSIILIVATYLHNRPGH